MKASFNRKTSRGCSYVLFSELKNDDLSIALKTDCVFEIEKS